MVTSTSDQMYSCCRYLKFKPQGLSNLTILNLVKPICIVAKIKKYTEQFSDAPLGHFNTGFLKCNFGEARIRSDDGVTVTFEGFS